MIVDLVKKAKGGLVILSRIKLDYLLTYPPIDSLYSISNPLSDANFLNSSLAFPIVMNDSISKISKNLLKFCPSMKSIPCCIPS